MVYENSKSLLNKENVLDIARWNEEAAGKTVFAVNKFSDWTPEEKAALLGKPLTLPQKTTTKNVGSFLSGRRTRDTSVRDF